MQGFGNSAGDAGWTAAMRRGDFATGWRISDAVLAARDPAVRDDPALPYHLRWVWDGRPLGDRDVLVRCYHGLGDTIQFARYLAPLRSQAAYVTLEVQPELLPLLSGAADRVVPFDPAHPLAPGEVDVEIMELAHALRLGPDTAALSLPCPRPVATGAIGLCWEAGGWDVARSVPLGALLEALHAPDKKPSWPSWPSPPGLARWLTRPSSPATKISRVSLDDRVKPGHDGINGCAPALLSLQRGPAALRATAPAFLNPGDDDRDILRTAALIAGARLVVTVDTMVAHLAGALGAPTLLLLKHDADWRWGEAETTPWYPSLRLLRQSAPGDWTRPLAALRHLAED